MFIHLKGSLCLHLLHLFRYVPPLISHLLHYWNQVEWMGSFGGCFPQSKQYILPTSQVLLLGQATLYSDIFSRCPNKLEMNSSVRLWSSTGKLVKSYNVSPRSDNQRNNKGDFMKQNQLIFAFSTCTLFSRTSFLCVKTLPSFLNLYQVSCRHNIPLWFSSLSIFPNWISSHYDPYHLFPVFWANRLSILSRHL